MMLVQMNPAVVLGQMNPDFVPGMSALDRLHQGGFFFLQSSVSVFRSDVFECVESGLFGSYFFPGHFFRSRGFPKIRGRSIRSMNLRQ